MMPFSSRRFEDLFPKEDDVGLYYTRDKYGQLQAPRGYEFPTKENLKNYLTENEPKGNETRYSEGKKVKLLYFTYIMGLPGVRSSFELKIVFFNSCNLVTKS